MPNRREAVHQFYRSVPNAGLLLERAAASAGFAYRGPAITHALVTRTDLNGYSTWARAQSAQTRAAVLDAFFSTVVPAIERAGGVFFRDEGDCIVALFSDYFGRGASNKTVRSYCLEVTPKLYGVPQLSAKTCVATGDVAFFQKRHEAPTGDWSAEGEPFVRAARLEQAVSSLRHVVMYEADYDAHFEPVAEYAPAGAWAPWTLHRESLQVSGVGASGGWARVARLEHNS